MTAADTPPVDFGTPVVVVRRGPVALRFRLRTALVTAAVTAAAIVVALVSLALGDLPLSIPQVVGALSGTETGIVGTVVVEWRLPRVLAGMVFGAAMGVSGAIFQSLTRNPLASPDVIGLTAGAYAGGLVAIILLGGGFAVTAAGALVGGVATALVVYLLSYRSGLLGFRLIIVGIALSAMLTALSTYLLVRARLEVAMAAATWGAGTMTGVGWPQLVPTAVVVAIALIGVMAFSPALHQLELGDDAAHALGVRVERSRQGLIACAVALTAVTTAAAGPIAFVSLAAPQVARRLAHTAGTGLVPSAAMGALILVASDAIAQHALPVPLPVGVVTVVLGGGYLIWLLIHETRRRR